MVTTAVSRIVGRGIFWAGVIVAVAGLASLSVASRAGAQEAKVRLQVPSVNEQVGNVPFPVEVVVEDAANLGAFEFKLLYDPSILRFVEVTAGPFLGSSGRVVRCLDPLLTSGSVDFVCVTLGPEPAGPDGSGTLATVTFEPVRSEATPLRFEVLTLAQPDAQRIPAAAVDGLVAFGTEGAVVTPVPVATTTTTAPTMVGTGVTATEAVSVGTPSIATTPLSANSNEGGGTNWALWGSVIGAAAVVVVAAAGIAWWFRAREPT